MYGPLVRQARTSRGLTQRQLAEASGVARTSISAIENDRRAPSAETLHRLLATCGYELAVSSEHAVPSQPHEAPTVTAETPIEVRVRVITAVLDLAETIARRR